jgi:hypothetical protein
MRRILLAVVAAASVWVPFAMVAPAVAQTNQCDRASYPTVCIPTKAVAGNLNCANVPYRDLTVAVHPDPHGFDADKDGIGCESPSSGTPSVTEAAFLARYGLPGATTATTYATSPTIAPRPTVPPTAPPLPGVLPSSSSASTAVPARTGRNEHLMLLTATVAIALGTLVLTITPPRGRHAK